MSRGSSELECECWPAPAPAPTPPPPRPCACPPAMVCTRFTIEIGDDVDLPPARINLGKRRKRKSHGRGPCYDYYDEVLRRIPSRTYYVV